MADRCALTSAELNEFRDRGVLLLRDRVPDETIRSLEVAFGRAVDRIAEQRGVADALLAGAGYDERYRALRQADSRPVMGAWRRVLVSPEVHAVWPQPQVLG